MWDVMNPALAQSDIEVLQFRENEFGKPGRKNIPSNQGAWRRRADPDRVPFVGIAKRCLTWVRLYREIFQLSRVFVKEFEERSGLVCGNLEYREDFKPLEIWEPQGEVGYQGPKIMCAVRGDAYGC